MVGERLKERFDREPIWRRAEGKFAGPGHRARNKINSSTGDKVPRFDNRNFGGGIGVGTVGAVVATVLEDTVGLPFGGSSDIVNVETLEGGDATRYEVNVNAPIEHMAKVRAFIDSGTGFTSILTDELDVEDVEIIDVRTLRDTYQIELIIRD